MKVELDLPNSNFTTKADLKNATGVDTSKLAKKVDLANLKSNVDKLDVDKLKNEPTNFSKVDKLEVDKGFTINNMKKNWIKGVCKLFVCWF